MSQDSVTSEPRYTVTPPALTGAIPTLDAINATATPRFNPGRRRYDEVCMDPGGAAMPSPLFLLPRRSLPVLAGDSRFIPEDDYTRQTDRQADAQKDRQTGRQTVSYTDRQTDGRAGGRASGLAGGRAGGRADRQTDRQKGI
ncbi:hypothetical protein DPMN_146713 [Dreissena polymorpha]|uniref:Uncharacterized protein n=1 Tax=Dreissena polymorpha TaxID=45954 RepID=A0A9D4F726_DREPO|nr:hypothetical protein DPMN_146713 [Dreissena polymorpha]